MNIRCSYEVPTSGMVCKRWAMRGSNFCYHHRPLPADLPHDGIMLHPLARLADPADIYDVLRETLNAARQGRIPTAQAYAVGYLAQVLLKVYDRVRIDQRDDGLARQIIPTLADEEAAADIERNYTMPLPVQSEDPTSTPAVTPPHPLFAPLPGEATPSAAANASAPTRICSSDFTSPAFAPENAAAVSSEDASAAAPPQPPESSALIDVTPVSADDSIPTSPADLLAEINRVSNLLRTKSPRPTPRPNPNGHRKPDASAAPANGKPPADALAALAASAAAHP